MTTKLTQIANKWAMKLNLESRPSSGNMIDYDPEHEVETEELPPEPTSTSLLESLPESRNKHYLTSITVTMHEIREKLSLGDYEGILELIEDTRHDLNKFEEFVATKVED